MQIYVDMNFDLSVSITRLAKATHTSEEAVAEEMLRYLFRKGFASFEAEYCMNVAAYHEKLARDIRNAVED